MALNKREKEEIARMVNDTLNNQFAFFARPVILKHLDSRIGGFPEWLRSKTVGEIDRRIRGPADQWGHQLEACPNME